MIQAISSSPHLDKSLLLFPTGICLVLDFLAALHFPSHYVGITYKPKFTDLDLSLPSGVEFVLQVSL